MEFNFEEIEWTKTRFADDYQIHDSLIKTKLRAKFYHVYNCKD